MLCHLRVACASHWLLNFDIEHKLNSGKFLIAFSEITIVLIIVKMIEESNPLDMATLTKAKEQIWDNTYAAHFHYLFAADRLNNDN
jgi:hypothetical protein